MKSFFICVNFRCCTRVRNKRMNEKAVSPTSSTETSICDPYLFQSKGSHIAHFNPVGNRVVEANGNFIFFFEKKAAAAYRLAKPLYGWK